MVNIYVTSKDARESGKSIIDTNDREFEKEISSQILTDTDIGFMKQIDKVSRADGESITTPIGTTDIYHLSTGCKTLIIVNHILNQIGFSDCPIVDITECGENVIKEIFKLIDNTEVQVILKHSYISSIPEKEYTFNVIGKRVLNSIYDLATLIDSQGAI